MPDTVKNLWSWIVDKVKLVEKKVLAAGVWAFVATAAVGVLQRLQVDQTLIGGLPPQVQWLVLALVPAAVTFLGAWAASHTPRPDLEG